MPSDAKKKKEQQKKAVRKQKDIKKTKNQEDEDQEQEQDQDQDDQQSNEDETTTTTTTTTTSTDEQSNGVNETVSSKPVQNGKKREDDEDEIEARLKAISLLEKTNSDNRSCTDVLASLKLIFIFILE